MSSWRSVSLFGLAEIVGVWRRSPRLLGVLFSAALVANGFAAVGRAEIAREIADQVAVVGALVLGMASMSGIVSDDLQTGVVNMWAQKGARLRQFYLLLFLCRMTAILLVACGLLALMSPLVWPLGVLEVSNLGTYASYLFVVAGLVSTIVFAMSAAGLLRDSIGAVAYIVVSTLLAMRVATYDGVRWEVLRLFLFPIDSIFAVTGNGGLRDEAFSPAFVFFFQCSAWIAFGAFMLKRSTRQYL